MLLTPQAESIAAETPRLHGRSPTVLLSALGTALLALALLYFPTFASIVSIWNTSETFAHGYIILPISIWLIWRRRAYLPLQAARPFWPSAVLLLLAGAGWLLANLGGVQVVMQYAVVMMIPLIVLLVAGPRLTWSMAFPLAFLLLAVPFGEIFIEPLISFTADFTVRALQLTGIPVLRSGTRFEIPSGSWSVVEACSGVRYLISSVTLGCLYAYLTFRSRGRQIAFLVLSIIVPIIANGLRAYMIVMIGHLSGMKLAVGFDHLIYGWVFFGLVMFLMFWIGSYWRQDEAPAQPQAATLPGQLVPTATSTSHLIIAAVVAIACIGVWPLYARMIERAQGNAPAVTLAPLASSWQPATAFTPWTPSFAPASASRMAFFQSGGEQVGLSLLYYRNQHRGATLITSTNRLVGSNNVLHQIGEATRAETLGSNPLTVRETILDGPGGKLVVWHWYWIDGRFTASNYAGKLLQAKGKLLLQGDDGASVMVVAPVSGPAAADVDTARKSLRSFLTANLAPIETVLTKSRQP